MNPAGLTSEKRAAQAAAAKAFQSLWFNRNGGRGDPATLWGKPFRSCSIAEISAYAQECELRAQHADAYLRTTKRRR